jgi:hypothetical protein
MRHLPIWMLALLVMPAVASANSAAGPAPERAAADLERVVPGTTAAGLDLRLDAAELDAQYPPAGPSATAIDRRNRGPAVPSPAAQPGLSFGMELKPRGSINDLAHMSPVDEPGVQDNLERWLEHSRVGVRGSYRF